MSNGFSIQFYNKGRAVISEWITNESNDPPIITTNRQEFIEKMEDLYLKYGVKDEVKS